MSHALLLKDNKLFIRLKEGEFEVSNPEIIGDPETIKILFNDGKPFGGMPIEPVWPGGVELIHQYKDRGQWHDATKKVQWRMYNNNHDIRDVARLLPKEKKENKICIASHGPASTQAESAYKEFEEAAIKQGHVIESPEPQEEIVKHIASIAWKGAANAYRMYPDNKHTFASYWDAAKDQFKEFFTRKPE